MRIRATKPEFWKSDRISSIDWDVVYDGPPPRRTNELAPASSRHEYVYLLFDYRDDPVYVGRSFRPADRLAKHRRKPWWRDVVSAVIIRVAERPYAERPPWQKVGPNTARLEAYLIKSLKPPQNVGVPLRGELL